MDQLFLEKYQNQVLLSKTGTAEIYATHGSDQKQLFILKSLKENTADIFHQVGQKKRFIREIDFMSTLKHHRISELVDSYSDENEFYLVYPHKKGMTLEQFMTQHESVELSAALHIIIQLLEALEYVHSRGVVHCDISPGNIYVTENNDVELFDFGLALTEDEALQVQEGQIVGTPPYLSPEQLSFTDFKIDTRTDLFCTTALLYRLISGKIPFSIKEKSVSGYLDAILKSEIQPLHNVPIIINMILLKGLRPTPEERYQTAIGMRYDLQEALKEIQGDQSSLLFPGEKDSIIAVNRRKLFIGRLHELSSLKSGLTQIQNGHGGSFLFYGQSGMGKTEIIREFRTMVDESRVIFLSTKCNRFTVNQPFSVFRSLILDVLSRVIKFSHQKKDEIRENFNARLLEQSGIICKLIPEMAALFITVKDVDLVEQEKEAERAIQSLFMLFKEILKISRFIFYIDDIQWIDKSSYHIFKRVLDQELGCMLVFNYRTDSPTQDLYIHGEDIKRIGISKQMEIAPFVESEVSELIVQRFGQIEHLNVLAHVLYQKTDKSPFTVTEAIRFLVNQSILRLNPEKGWFFNKDELQTLPVQFDPIALILNKIDSLDTEEKEYLQVASLIEGAFERRVIEEILGISSQQSSVISRETENKGFIARGLRKGYTFVHDKIQESIAQTLGKDEKFALHEKLGRLYEGYAHHDPDAIFHAADHFLKSKSIREAITTCNRAAYYAREKLAFDQAIHFFKQTSFMALQYGKTNANVGVSFLDIQKSLGELFILAGKNKQAINVYQGLLKQVVSLESKDELEIKYKIGVAHHNMAEFEESIRYFLDCLDKLNVTVPKNKILAVMDLVINLIKQFAIPKRVRKLFHKVNEEHDFLKIRILNKISYSFFFQDMVLCLLTHYKSLNLSDYLSNCYEKCETYSLHMVPAFQLFMKKRALRYTLKSIEIAKQIDRKDLISQCNTFTGMYFYYNSNWKLAEQYFSKSIENSIQIGDVWEQLISLEHYKRSKVYQGQFLDSIKFVRSSDKLSQICQDKHYTLTTKVFQLLIDTLRLQPNTEKQFEDIFFLLNNTRGKLTHHIIKTVLAEIYILRGNFTLAYSTLSEVMDEVLAKDLTQEYVIPSFHLLCQVIVLDLIDKRKGEKGISKDSKFLMGQFRKVLFNGIIRALPFPCHRIGCYRSVAWYFYFCGFSSIAVFLFKRAAKLYHSIDMKYEEANTFCDMAIVLENKGYPGEVKDAYSKAFGLYKKCGALAKIQLIETKFPKEFINLEEDDVPAVEVGTLVSDITNTSDSNYLRVEALFDASNSLNEMNELHQLLEKILAALIKITGAQHGFLFLSDKPEFPEKELLMDFEGHKFSAEEVNYSKDIIQWVNSHKQILLIRDGLKEEAFSDCREKGIRSVMCVPLQSKNEYLGCVYLSNNRMADLFNKSSEKSAQILSTQAGIVLENAMLVNHLKRLNIDLETKVRIQTRDILNQKNQLEQYTLKLLESERMKGILTGTLVHDIKNYVAGIEGNLKVLVRKYGEEPKTIRNIHNAQDSCHDIINLASNLLDIGKMEEGKLEIRLQMVGRKELSEIVEKFRKDPLFEDKGIQIHHMMNEEGAFEVEADLYLLERVFQNLFNNVAKYTPDGGEVRIGFLHSRGEKIIYVFNSGDPIPVEVRESLFEKYSRLGDKRSQYSKGLGLFFCKMVMTSHGGRIWVDTDEKGNYFKLGFKETATNYNKGRDE